MADALGIVTLPCHLIGVQMLKYCLVLGLLLSTDLGSNCVTMTIKNFSDFG